MCVDGQIVQKTRTDMPTYIQKYICMNIILFYFFVRYKVTLIDQEPVDEITQKQQQQQQQQYRLMCFFMGL